MGGLGVGSLQAKNLNLLGKWKWRFLTEKGALWRKVIKCFFGDDGGFNSNQVIRGYQGTWCEIIKVVSNIKDIDTSFKTSFRLKVSNGCITLFWKDKWCEDDTCLKDHFPRLYALELNQDCFIKDRWRKLYLNGSWDKDALGSFKVKTLTCGLQDILLSDHSIGPHHMWNLWIPRKINICVWRASIDRLPTRTNLISRGVNITSTGFPFCHNEDEYIDHCLICCPQVITIWRKVWSWWQLDTPVSFPSFSISDISLGTFTNLGCPKLNKVIYGVFQCGIWVIWKWRNKIVHASPDS
ncbi:RNA-directed DNA polymerase, eukaryota, reverse transcriptase zinc-binding domain protein, partial [Tanacetum coccineum]